MDGIFVGIDVAKDKLDVHVLPSGEGFTVARDMAGIDRLIETLRPVGPRLIVVEATGGFETVVAAGLGAARLPLAVVNPYAEALTFRSESTRMRRDHAKYLTLIDSVVLLYQHQRQIKTAEVEGRQVEYVEVTIEDIEQANKLMSQVLGTASEELSGPARKLLDEIQKLVEEKAKEAGVAPAAVHFLRRDIREYTGWSDSQIKAHIRQLEDLEYVRVSRGERGRTYRYELAAGAGRRLPGLVDGVALRELVRKSGVVGHGLVPAAQPNFAEAATQSQVESPKVGQPVKMADPIKSSEVEVHA
ncbi:MAG: transposase [Elusimicrobiota bacterium]